MKRMILRDRILRSLALRRGEVILRDYFCDWGSASQVTRTLQSLLASGALVRLGYGVYAKARPSALSGRSVPRQPLEVLASETFKRLDIPAVPGTSSQSYFTGSTTQIPMQAVFNMGDSRFNRCLTVGARSVRYERNQRARA